MLNEIASSSFEHYRFNGVSNYEELLDRLSKFVIFYAQYPTDFERLSGPTDKVIKYTVKRLNNLRDKSRVYSENSFGQKKDILFFDILLNLRLYFRAQYLRIYLMDNFLEIPLELSLFVNTSNLQIKDLIDNYAIEYLNSDSGEIIKLRKQRDKKLFDIRNSSVTMVELESLFRIVHDEYDIAVKPLSKQVFKKSVELFAAEIIANENQLENIIDIMLDSEFSLEIKNYRLLKLREHLRS